MSKICNKCGWDNIVGENCANCGYSLKKKYNDTIVINNSDTNKKIDNKNINNTTISEDTNTKENKNNKEYNENIDIFWAIFCFLASYISLYLSLFSSDKFPAIFVFIIPICLFICPAIGISLILRVIIKYPKNKLFIILKIFITSFIVLFILEFLLDIGLWDYILG